MSYKSHDNATNLNTQGIPDYEEISNVQASSSSAGLGFTGFSSTVQHQAVSSPRTSKKKPSFLGSLGKGTIRKGTIITKPQHQGFLPEEPFEEIKEGDAERIRIMNLVKEGKLSVEEAMEHAKNLGVMSPVESTNDFEDSEDKIFNFGVYKYGRNRASLSRRILQFDFQEKVLCIIQKGNRNKKFAFSEIRGFDSEDGLRFFIYFDSDYELDADSVEEKNKICHLLDSIVQQNRGDEPDGVFETPSLEVARIIKEGQIEKKGHSAAFMMWPRRWLRIQQGELSYYKIGEENQTALNMVKLGPGLAEVKSLDHNAFIIITSKKEYSFRVLNLNNVAESAVEKERDAWIEAITEASQLGFRKSRVVSLPDEKAISSSVQEQEKYLKNVVKTLQRELEQLASVLSVVNAPIQATVQVKKVKDVVRTLDSQVKTGVLSWTMRQVLQARKNSLQDNTSVSSQVSNASLPKRKDSGRLPPAPPRQEHGYESVIFHQRSVEHAPASEFITQQPRLQNTSDTSSTQAPIITGSSPGTTPPVRPPRRRSPAAKPYETVEIIPRKFGNQETVSELGEYAGEPWSSHATPQRPPKPGSFKGEANDQGESFYQKPPEEPVTVITAVNEVYDNVRLKNTPCTPTESHSESIADSDLSIIRKSAAFDTTEGNELSTQTITKHDETTTIDQRIETTDGNLEIDSGGMGCPNIDRAMEERRQLLIETETREGVVLLSVQKLKENSNDQTETHAAEEVEDDTAFNKDRRSVSGSNAPPPPPLPPGGIPPPPPLMGSGMDRQPKRACAVEPRVKLRPFFWNKVSAQMVSKSVWMSISDQSMNIDLNLLEEMFQIEEKEKTVNPAPTKPTSKMLLDPKRAQNLGIFLSGFKLTTKEIDEKLGVFRKEDGALPMDHVIALKRFLPTAEECEMYKNYKEDPNSLVPEDQFMMKLCEIPDLDKRLDLLLVIMEFPIQYEDLAPNVNHLFQACVELYNSKNFLLLLEYVLSIGNILNSGSNRGGAYGFRLTSLSKLADIRAKNKKYTLLKFLIAQLKQSNPESLNFTEELKSVPKAAACSVKGLLGEVEVMRKDLGKIKKHSNDLLLKQSRTNAQDVKLVNDIQAFVNEYEGKLDDLCDKCRQMKQIYSKVLVRFGEPSNSDSEELLGAISNFITQFKKAVKELQGPKHNKGLKLEGLREAIAQRQKSTEDTMSIASMSSVSSLSTISDRDYIDAGKTQTQNKADEPKKNDVVLELKPAAKTAPPGPPPVVHTLLSPKSPPKPPMRANLKPTKQGFLDKLSGGKHQSRKWDTRYFELTDTGYLHYYKKPDGGKPINSIYLRGCPVEADENNPCVILVKTDERDWSLKALNAEEARIWKEALSFYTEKQN